MLPLLCEAFRYDIKFAALKKQNKDKYYGALHLLKKQKIAIFPTL